MLINDGFCEMPNTMSARQKKVRAFLKRTFFTLIFFFKSRFCLIYSQGNKTEKLWISSTWKNISLLWLFKSCWKIHTIFKFHFHAFSLFHQNWQMRRDYLSATRKKNHSLQKKTKQKKMLTRHVSGHS